MAVGLQVSNEALTEWDYYTAFTVIEFDCACSTLS